MSNNTMQQLNFNGPEDSLQLQQITLITKNEVKQAEMFGDFVARLAKPETNVLYYQRDKSCMKKVYIIPIFCRLMINRITAINLDEDYCQLSGKIYITMRHKGVPQQYVSGLLNNMNLTINGSQTLKLNMDDEKKSESYQNQQDETATFIKTMKFQALLDAEIFFAPFERLNIQIQINIMPYFYEIRDQETGKLQEIVQFKFNNMINHQKDLMVAINPIKKKMLKYGQYSLADSLDHLRISVINDQGAIVTSNNIYHQDIFNRKKEEEDGQSKEKNSANLEFSPGVKGNGTASRFNEASSVSFKFMLYRRPTVTIVTIFVPMWVLGFIVLMAFMMGNSFDNRVILIATVYISFATYFQVIRSVLPKSPQVSLMQILVYSIISVCIFGLIDSLVVRDDPNLTRRGIFDRPLFIVSFLIQVGSFVAVIFSLMYHQYCLKTSYHRKEDSAIASVRKISTKIYQREWENQVIREKLFNLKHQILYADTHKKIIVNVKEANKN